MIGEDVARLFEGGSSDRTLAIVLRFLRRSGEPFLYTPCESRLASAALQLYAAQKWGARLGRTILKTVWAMGLPMPFKKVTVRINEESPLLKYIAAISNEPSPKFAILPGNPRAKGQRFILLLFDQHGQPSWVVKAGLTPEAKALLAAEIDVLRQLPANTPGRPTIHRQALDERTVAFAVSFVRGSSPRSSHENSAMGSLLHAWIDTTRYVRLTDLKVWHRLRDCAPEALSPFDPFPLESAFHPVIFHGDFAPWNVRVLGASWTALDWERGELVGPPAWDWFHFVVQSAVLIEKCNARRVNQKLAALLRCPAFLQYAKAAAIRGREVMLAKAYLLYCAKVLRPTESYHVFQELAASSNFELQDRL